MPRTPVPNDDRRSRPLSERNPVPAANLMMTGRRRDSSLPLWDDFLAGSPLWGESPDRPTPRTAGLQCLPWRSRSWMGRTSAGTVGRSGDLPTTAGPAHNSGTCPQQRDLPTTARLAHNSETCPQQRDLPTTARLAHNSETCPQQRDLPTTARRLRSTRRAQALATATRTTFVRRNRGPRSTCRCSRQRQSPGRWPSWP